MLNRKDLLGLEDMSVDEIDFLLGTAASMKEIFVRSVKKVPALRGKTIINLFYEPSTRTRTSFEIAAKRLSADVSSIATSTSSVVKGESLIDTARTLEAMNADAIIMRHSASGAPHFLAAHVKASVINAGDGSHEHPTQGLLDAYTIREKKGRIDGLKVAIIGDIAHSRVARSNIWGLTKLGATVRIAAPPTLLPLDVDKLPVEVYFDVDRALRDVDVVYILRIQRERQESKLLPSIQEYVRFYGIDKRRLRLAKEDALVMHPGPMNRGIEIAKDVAESDQSVIEEQVTNGIAIRMAVLYSILGGRGR
ncbi:MAG: aspartate carbamoyltransferase catalytic subunit [bacterium]